MGYIAWTLGHVLLDRFDDRLAGAEVVLVPVLASFVMVMWDLCIDPASYHNRRLDLARWRRLLRSAVSQLSRLVSLRRHDLLGVCILFAAFISVDTAKSWRTLHVDIARGHVCSGYAAEIDRADRGRLRQVTSHDGHVWWTGDIHTASALVALFTMLFVTVLALVRVRRSPVLH